MNSPSRFRYFPPLIVERIRRTRLEGSVALLSSAVKKYKGPYRVDNLNPGLRKKQIEAYFEALRREEPVWVVWDNEPPILMESRDKDLSAPYNSFRIDFRTKLIERP